MRRILWFSCVAVLCGTVAVPAVAGQYSDAVDALSPTHYYRLNETVFNTGSATVIDSGSGGTNGTHGGLGLNASDSAPEVGDLIGQAGFPGPDVAADGTPLVGFDADNRSIFNNDAAYVDLGPGQDFASPTMTLAMWFKAPCDADNPGTTECQGPPASSGGERLFTNNFEGQNTGGSTDLDDIGHLQVDFGWGANLIVSMDNRFSDPLKSNFQIPHRDGHPGPTGPDPTGLAVKDNNWHHLVVSRNGDVLTDMLLVVDGEEIVQDRWADSTDSWGITGPANALIGTRDRGDHTFNGWIDEVALWLGRQLTVEEAQGLYLAATGAVSALVGDMNGDGEVNFGDLTPFSLGLTNIPAYEAMYPDVNRVVAGDVNTDGEFNFGDLSPFANLLTTGGAGSGTAVPEPSCVVLSLLGLTCCSLRRRRNA